MHEPYYKENINKDNMSLPFKTFGLAEKGEKMYKVELLDSKLVEDNYGGVIKTLEIRSVLPTNNFYNLHFFFTDNTDVYLNRNNDVSIVEVDKSDIKHPMGLTEAFYSQDRGVLLDAVNKRLSDHLDRMNKLRSESLMLLNSTVIAQRIVDQLGKIYPKEHPMTEVEFAEMAL